MEILPEYRKAQTMELSWSGQILARLQDLQQKLEGISDPQQRTETAKEGGKCINQDIFSFVRLSVKGDKAYGINHNPNGPGSYTTPLSDLQIDDIHCQGVEYVNIENMIGSLSLVIPNCSAVSENGIAKFDAIIMPVLAITELSPSHPTINSN